MDESMKSSGTELDSNEYLGLGDIIGYGEN